MVELSLYKPTELEIESTDISVGFDYNIIVNEI